MELEDLVIELCQHGMARCALGWGKYPLGVLGAIEILKPHCDSAYVNRAGMTVADAIDQFKKRLAE